MKEFKEIEETLLDRLKQVIKLHYGTQKKMAEDLGISRTIMSEWWAGRSKPRAETLQEICEKTNTSMDWLVLGRTEPYVDENLFHNIFNEAEIFAKNNSMSLNSFYLLNAIRIVISEKKTNKNITLQEIFFKYKNILLVFKNNLK